MSNFVTEGYVGTRDELLAYLGELSASFRSQADGCETKEGRRALVNKASGLALAALVIERWKPSPPSKSTTESDSPLTERLDMLEHAHAQHRASDNQFLRSLGALTEAHQAMGDRVNTLAAQLDKIANSVQPAVCATAVVPELCRRVDVLETRSNRAEG